MHGPPLVFRIAPPLLAALRQHAREGLPNECCGLIGGQFAGHTALAEWIVPVPNEINSPVRFRMEPREQLRAFQALESRSMEMVAIYHSHPRGPQHPSQTDVEEFLYPGVISVILSPAAPPDDWLVCAFWIWNRDIFSIPISPVERV